MKIKRFAFTLAETLITLGIIGIVATITIPGLITKFKDARDSTLLKEDYSILQQMMESANEDGATTPIPTGNNIDEMKNWFNTYIAPYVKTAHICYYEAGCWTNDAKWGNGTTFAQKEKCAYQAITFTLFNGGYVCIDDAGDSRFGVITNGHVAIHMLVDINGDKKPNIVGKDIFALVAKEDKLLPGGYNMTKAQIDNNCNPNCSGNWCGAYCTVKAQHQGFKLPVMNNK